MRLGIYGKKIGMTQVFDENGMTVPVTVLSTADCFITQVKTKESDSYAAIQVAFGDRKPQNVGKPLQGHYKKASVAAKAQLKEIRFCKNKDDISQFKPGQRLTSGMFARGDKVDVTGIVKGRGFTGVMKRLNYHGKHATHGTSKYFRHGGSNGSNTFPGRVLKNKGMPGQYGNAPVTTSNLLVVDVKPEEELILLRGAVPGSRSGHVFIASTKKQLTAPTGRTWVAAN